MAYIDVLKQLYPYRVGGVHEADLVTAANALDSEQSRIDAVLDEMFPDTATAETIFRWERRYGVIPDSGKTLSDRRKAVIAKRRQRGGASSDYYKAIASALGYDIDVSAHADGWRLPGVLPGTLYSEGELWRMTITVNGIAGPASDLEALFNDIKRAHVLVEYVYNP